MEKMAITQNLESCIFEEFSNIIGDANFYDNYASALDHSPEYVCYESFNGFVPYTNGGIVLTLLTDLLSIVGSGIYPKTARNELERVIDDSEKMALEQFVDDNKEKLKTLFPNKTTEELKDYDNCNYHDLYDIGQGELAEELSGLEHQALTEGSCFAYQFKVFYFSADNSRNQTGQDELYFFCGVNTDFEYIRDSGLELSYEKTVPLKGLTNKKIKQIIQAMVDSI